MVIASVNRVGLIHALNFMFPGTGPGGYFRNGSTVSGLDDELKGKLLANQIARTQLRAWMECELGAEFGIIRSGVKPSLQLGFKPHRPFPDTSVKWNKITKGTTSPLQIEEATVRYLNDHILGWGNNRSPNNDYTAGSTQSYGLESPCKTVFFDHLSGTGGVPTASEAFTGLAPGVRDIQAWEFLSKAGRINPGLIINLQNERGQSISEANACTLVQAGYRVSVVPFGWWSPYLSNAYCIEALKTRCYLMREGSRLELFYPQMLGRGIGAGSLVWKDTPLAKKSRLGEVGGSNPPRSTFTPAAALRSGSSFPFRIPSSLRRCPSLLRRGRTPQRSPHERP